MPPDIGLVAPARSGKDTVARILGEQMGYTRVAFADPLRAILADVDPILWSNEDQDYQYRLSNAMYPGTMPRWALDEGLTPWEYAKDEEPEVRRLLQRLGVAVREHVDPGAWVYAAMRERRRHPGPCVFTDVRFVNEVAAIRNRGGIIVRIDRPGFEPAPTAHVSETALADLRPDYVILNDGTVCQLHERVARFTEFAGLRR